MLKSTFSPNSKCFQLASILNNNELLLPQLLEFVIMDST